MLYTIPHQTSFTQFHIADLGMSEFKASSVAFEVQKKFANKVLSNKTVVNGLIDDKTANLLDKLNKLIFTHVSHFTFLCCNNL